MQRGTPPRALPPWSPPVTTDAKPRAARRAWLSSSGAPSSVSADDGAESCEPRVCAPLTTLRTSDRLSPGRKGEPALPRLPPRRLSIVHKKAV